MMLVRDDKSECADGSAFCEKYAKAYSIYKPRLIGYKYTAVACVACLCGLLAQCAQSLKRLSAGPGFNPQTGKRV